MKINISRQTKDWEHLFGNREHFEKWYVKYAHMLDYPRDYLGDEPNTISFNWDSYKAHPELLDASHPQGAFKILLVEPFAYDNMATNLAIPLFYQQFHEAHPEWVVERAYYPSSERDRERLIEAGFPPLSLEGRMPYTAFDVICFSQCFIGQEFNIIDLLLRSGIAPVWQQRTDSDPIIIRGGASNLNPSATKDVCDLYYIGEGDEGLLWLMERIHEGLLLGKSNEDILLEAIKNRNCLWAPRFYEERFDDQGNLMGMFRLREDVPKTIRRDYIHDLDHMFVLTKPPVSFDYFSCKLSNVEISRGCVGKCSFCQASFTNAPYRARSADFALKCIKEVLRQTGGDQAAAISFSGCGHPECNSFFTKLYSDVTPSITQLSQRVDEFASNPSYAAFAIKANRGKIAFGLEGNSQRIRDAVSKNYTEDDIIEAIRIAQNAGFKRIKFMMIESLPGETPEDTMEIVELGRRIKELLVHNCRPGEELPTIVFSWTILSIFPFTPYQWCRPRREAVSPVNEAARQLEEMGFKTVRGVFMNSETLWNITQLLMRADSRLQNMFIQLAQEECVYFDRRMTNNPLDRIHTYFAEHDVPGWDYWFRECDADTIFPWDFIQMGPTKDYLWKRYQQSLSLHPENSPKCMDRCANCGACDAEDLRRKQKWHISREQDRKQTVDVHIQPANSEPSVQTLVLDIEADLKHRFAAPLYWIHDIGRALMLSDLPIRRSSLSLARYPWNRYAWAWGLNRATVDLIHPLDILELDELAARIQKHATHFTVLSIHLEEPRKHKEDAICSVLENNRTSPDTKFSYEVPLPPLDHAAFTSLNDHINEIMASPTWNITSTCFGDFQHETSFVDARPFIDRLFITHKEKTPLLYMTLIGSTIAPYDVYQNLLDTNWEQIGSYPVHCVSID